MAYKGKIPCIVCGKALHIDEADRPLTRLEDGTLSCQMVMHGVVCRAHGNYGSAAYDPLVDTDTLGFAICDECFGERKDRMMDVKVGGALCDTPAGSPAG